MRFLGWTQSSLSQPQEPHGCNDGAGGGAGQVEASADAGLSRGVLCPLFPDKGKEPPGRTASVWQGNRGTRWSRPQEAKPSPSLWAGALKDSIQGLGVRQRHPAMTVRCQHQGQSRRYTGRTRVHPAHPSCGHICHRSFQQVPPFPGCTSLGGAKLSGAVLSCRSATPLATPAHLAPLPASGLLWGEGTHFDSKGPDRCWWGL